MREAETRVGDALHHVARRLSRHPGAIRERQAALTGSWCAVKPCLGTGRETCHQTRRGLKD